MLPSDSVGSRRRRTFSKGPVAPQEYGNVLTVSQVWGLVPCGGPRILGGDRPISKCEEESGRAAISRGPQGWLAPRSLRTTAPLRRGTSSRIAPATTSTESTRRPCAATKMTRPPAGRTRLIQSMTWPGTRSARRGRRAPRTAAGASTTPGAAWSRLRPAEPPWASIPTMA